MFHCHVTYTLKKKSYFYYTRKVKVSNQEKALGDLWKKCKQYSLKEKTYQTGTDIVASFL